MSRSETTVFIVITHLIPFELEIKRLIRFITCHAEAECHTIFISFIEKIGVSLLSHCLTVYALQFIARGDAAE